jgi:hypothetical protein
MPRRYAFAGRHLPARSPSRSARRLRPLQQIATDIGKRTGIKRYGMLAPKLQVTVMEPESNPLPA